MYSVSAATGLHFPILALVEQSLLNNSSFSEPVLESSLLTSKSSVGQRLTLEVNNSLTLFVGS